MQVAITGLQATAQTDPTLQPAIEQQGVATSADLGPDTIADRLVQEVASSGGIVVGRAEIGAWSRV